MSIEYPSQYEIKNKDLEMDYKHMKSYVNRVDEIKYN